MNRIPSLLSRLESRLQMLIEGNLARFFPAYDLRQDLIHHLITALQVEIREGPGGSLLAPDQFTIFLPAEQASIFQEHQDLLDELVQALIQGAKADNLQFLKLPAIRLLPAPEANTRGIQVLAQFSMENTSQTSRLSQQPGMAPLKQAQMPEAFLIAEGTNFFAVRETVINIGRQEDNHLVLHDGRVSRKHAQLRFIEGRFMLFDLGSTGGTYVNGVKITQHMLSPGDVITLGGVPLVFGIEPSGFAGETQEYKSGSNLG